MVPVTLTMDGSHGEGGGQVLRSTLTLATITGKPVHLTAIRAHRSTPGLHPQHLTAVRAAAALCKAEVTGDYLGSQELTFTPGGPVVPGAYTFDVTDAADGGSAGAVTLILQTVLLPLALAPGASTVTLRGGTAVAWSPPALYIEKVYFPILARMGITARVTAHRWGFYPRGDGELTVEIAGNAVLQPLDCVERGRLLEVEGIAYASQLPSHIPQRMSDRAAALLRSEHLPVRVTPEHVSALDPAAGIFLAARYEHGVAGFSALGRKGMPSEEVAETACRQLLAYHRGQGCADAHLGDQIVLPLVLAGGRGRVALAEITPHLLTNLWTVGHFGLTPASVEGKEGEAGLLMIGEEPRHD